MEKNSTTHQLLKPLCADIDPKNECKWSNEARPGFFEVSVAMLGMNTVGRENPI
jgi:hypothetical protein